MYHNNEIPINTIRNWVISGICLVLLIIVLCMVGCPKYNVWQQGLEGEAALARATQDRRIKVLEAEAKRDSASMEGQAEVVRAKGLAEANKIIKDSLSGDSGEMYLRYLWITNIEKGNGRETIYIPTEAGLPLLESTRRQPPPPQK